MPSIMERLSKNSTIKESAVLSESKFFLDPEIVQTAVPAMNVALSGRLDGGLTPGLTMFAGPSRHFKTAFTLLLVKAYLDKYPDAVCLWWDSEFGSPQSYFESFGIDTSRVIHSPITNIEQLKHDASKQIDEIKVGDHVILVVDSVGNLASKKEVEDAMEGKSVADMTRAKQLKSFFRIVTPHLKIKKIPMVVVNHTYMEIGLYPKAIVGGGTGSMYSSDTVFIVGRSQEKEGTDVVGYNFTLNVEKSRFVREKSKIPIEVSFEGGISTWSGLLDIAEAAGFVTKPKVGWFASKHGTKNYRRNETDTAEFWLPILKDPDFQSWVMDRYKLASNVQMISDDDIAKEISLVEYDVD
jgi:RecA/RadA recombinase